jgi:hypothetical protein
MPPEAQTPEQIAAAAAAAAAASPYASFDEGTRGYLQNKGLDKKTPLEALLEVSKFHREAEKFVGAPANELVRLPKDPNAPEWEGVHQRLGKPKEAKEYDFTTVKRTGDKPLEGALLDTIREAAFEGNLSKDGATRVAAKIVKHLDQVEANSTSEKAAALITEKKALADNWGPNAAANMVIAQGAVKALGVTPEAVAALEGVTGYAKVMEMFRLIGSKIGEDKFVGGGGGGGTNVMTKEAAIAEKKSLMDDKAWATRYLNGGREEKKQLDALDRIILNIQS